MKRFLGFLCALLLPLTALAEALPTTRDGVVTRGGVAEASAQTQFVLEGCYTLWYTDALVPVEGADVPERSFMSTSGADDVYLTITPVTAEGAELADLQDAAEANLAASGWESYTIEPLAFEGGWENRACEAITEDSMALFVAVRLDEKLYVCSAVFPMAEKNDVGADIVAAIASLNPHAEDEEP